jgi:hypothetical protein
MAKMAMQQPTEVKSMTWKVALSYCRIWWHERFLGAEKVEAETLEDKYLHERT